jgi:hypothetical protein
MESVTPSFFGKTVIIDQDVKYVGDGEDPKDNLGFQIWLKAYLEACKTTCPDCLIPKIPQDELGHKCKCKQKK